MRSAAVLLSTRRRAQRRTSRQIVRSRVRVAHRSRAAVERPGRRASLNARRTPTRSVKPRERIVHVVPRGFLPLVRH
jgi:hypothetical protein